MKASLRKKGEAREPHPPVSGLVRRRAPMLTARAWAETSNFRFAAGPFEIPGPEFLQLMDGRQSHLGNVIEGASDGFLFLAADCGVLQDDTRLPKFRSIVFVPTAQPLPYVSIERTSAAAPNAACAAACARGIATMTAPTWIPALRIGTTR